MRIFVFLGLLSAILGGLGGCASDPEITQLPDRRPDDEIIVVDEPNTEGTRSSDETEIDASSQRGQTEPHRLPETVAGESVEARRDAEPPVSGTYKRLRARDVLGGSFEFSLPGTVADVRRMLLDFESGADDRAWAVAFETLTPEAGELARARWHFEGKAGVNPVTVLSFVERDDTEGEVIRFRLVETDFGLAAFFGDYRLRPDRERADATLLRQRVFIDSGLWIANASAEEIEEGLREDARLMRARMRRE